MPPYSGWVLIPELLNIEKHHFKYTLYEWFRYKHESEIGIFVKCIACIFSGLITPNLQLQGWHTRVGPFLLTFRHTF